jgi:PAS domain S-box-containing protein
MGKNQNKKKVNEILDYNNDPSFASEEKYRTLVEQASDAIFVTDSNFCFLEVNLSCSLISGYSKDELIGKSIYDLLLPEDLEKFPLETDRLIKGGTVINERRIRRKDSTIVPVEMSSKILSDGRLQTIVRDISARKQTEEKFQMLVNAIKNINEFITLTNEKEEIIFVNHAFLKEYGYSEDEIIGKPIDIIRSAKNSPQVVKDIYQQTMTNRWQGELWNRRKDGSEFLIALSTTTVRDDKGKIIGLLGISWDITEQKRTESVIRQSDEIFSKIFHNSPIPICFTTFEDGKFIEANPSFLKLIDYERNEIIGKTSTEIGFYVKPEDRKIFIDKLREAGQLWGFELPFRKKSGERRESIRYLGNILYNNQNYIITFLLDITEKKKAEKDLLDSEDKFAKIFHSSPIPISISTYNEGRFIEVNESFLRLTGYSREEVIGATSEQIGLFIDPLVRSDLLIGLMREGKLWGIELAFKTKSGELRYSERYIEIISLNNQQFLLVFTIDITDRKKSKDSLLKSEERLKIINEQLHSLSAHLQNVREEERANLARDIHDELGQLLTAMKIDLGILGKKILKLNGDKIEDNFTEDVKSLDNFIDLTIKSVRKIISELRPEVLDQLGLIEAARWFISEFKTRYKINCEFRTELNEIMLDKSYSIALYRIIQESLSNIVHHSNADNVIISLSETKKKLFLDIKDNGIGFDMNILNDTKRFGLLGIRERVFLMGGEFEILSSVGQGTELIVKIPYLQK